MEKVLLSAEQAAELSLNKGYEWLKNQIFKQIRETAEIGESELHWGISYPFYKEYLNGDYKDLYADPFIKNIRKIKSLLSDFGYAVKFATCDDDNGNELVTDLVITWYNK